MQNCSDKTGRQQGGKKPSESIGFGGLVIVLSMYVPLGYALRVYGDVASDGERDCVLVSQDFAATGGAFVEEKRGRTMGFRR